MNLKNHSYRDVSKTPVEEFDSGSPIESEETVSVDKAGLWICGASCKDLNPEEVIIDRSVTDEAYIPLPFPEHQLDPQEWIHALATLFVCTLPKPTQFCDQDGYDIIPIRMIRPILGPKKEEDKHLENGDDVLQADMVSVRELSIPDHSTTAQQMMVTMMDF